LPEDGSTRATSAEDLLAAVELRRQLAESHAELERVRGQLARVESSTAYQATSVVVRGVRRPRTALISIPRDLFRLYRRGRARSGSSRPAALATPSVTVGVDMAAATVPPKSSDRPPKLSDFLAVAVTVRDRPVIAGILSPETIATLGPYATVNPLLPNDAEDVLRSSTPDLLLVDSSAANAGPWTGLGTYIAPERDRQMLELVRMARAGCVPAVLWEGQDAPAPLFVAAASVFDVVFGHAPSDLAPWHPGVHLATFDLAELHDDGRARGRARLRALFLDEATPVQLQRLLASVGLTYDMPTRAVSLLAEVTGASSADALVESVQRQLLRPVEAIVTGPANPAQRAVDQLRELGLRVAAGPADLTGWKAAVQHVGSTWVAVRTSPFPDPAHLLDLVIAAECATVEAVGYADVDFSTIDAVDLTKAIVQRQALSIDISAGLKPTERWSSTRRGCGCLGVVEVLAEPDFEVPA
jgi:hypothetical protein